MILAHSATSVEPRDSDSGIGDFFHPVNCDDFLSLCQLRADKEQSLQCVLAIFGVRVALRAQSYVLFSNHLYYFLAE